MVLYRKYRPQKFSELIGEKEIITILQNEIKQEKTAHAYLFAGPRGVGKTTMARILAKAVNCANRKKGEAEPCDQCLSCQEIAQGKSFDLIEIDAASNRGINEIRELKERIRFLPSLSRFRVFIIDEVHMLTPEAFNALLKTLEEPPSYVLFILATTKIHELPETIISRCQVFKFTKIPLEEIVDYLKEIAKKEGVKISEEVLKIIAFRSEGCARDAMSLLGQIIALGDKEITLEEAMLVLPPSQLNLVIDLLDLLIKKEAKGAIELVNNLLAEGGDLDQFITDFIDFLRKVFLQKVGVLDESYKFHLDEELNKNLTRLALSIDLKDLVRLIERFVKLKIGFEYSEIPQLPIELAILELSQVDSASAEPRYGGGK